MLLPKLIRSARNLYWRILPETLKRCIFRNSGDYWEKRYRAGGNSGSGSYGSFAQFKAETLNTFVAENVVRSVIEFGCGDGNQLALARYPRYHGVDVSPAAVSLCRERHAQDRTKTFATLDAYHGETAELALSLDVIYHLVEDAVYEDYMRRLFTSATHFVAVYSSNTEDNHDVQGPHIRHRQFTAWVEENAREWTLLRHIPNPHPYEGDGTRGSFADFFLFGRKPDASPTSGIASAL
jgi:SAM-dependent methyltransferase